MPPQLKIGHVINLLATSTPSQRKLTKGSMVHDFKTLGTKSARFKC